MKLFPLLCYLFPCNNFCLSLYKGIKKLSVGLEKQLFLSVTWAVVPETMVYQLRLTSFWFFLNTRLKQYIICVTAENPLSVFMLGGSESNWQEKSQKRHLCHQESATGRADPANDPPPQYCSAAGYTGNWKQLLPCHGAVSWWQLDAQDLREKETWGAWSTQIYPAAYPGSWTSAPGRSSSQVTLKTPSGKSRSLQVVFWHLFYGKEGSL